MLRQTVFLKDFVLRSELCEADTAAVGSLIRETGFFSVAEQAVAMELVRERLIRGAESGYEFWLLESPQDLLAYICYGLIPCTLASYDIYWIAVLPSMQGKGLGRYVMRQAEESIRKAGGRQIYIETSSREQYIGTRLFYLANGYQETSRLSNFYAPGDDRVTYAKIL
ncbi:MAG: GNAT family N-acetyltransferase [Candidatus Brocadiaceae bacterium]|nr:GNAT family N-acetyltransferase [Candidatus Brocadiaceae bacterium]